MCPRIENPLEALPAARGLLQPPPARPAGARLSPPLGRTVRLRRLLLALGLVVVALGTIAAGALGHAHLELRRLDPPLPDPDELARFDSEADLPVRLWTVNTASQRMPRRAVLDPGLDPDADAPYVMSHAAFVLEWADGRLFLIDAGLDREAALAFGAPIERFAGADPIEPHRSVADALGDAVDRVAGLGLTHLHVDHTAGATGLCARRSSPRPVRVFQTRLQAERGNYTTRPGRAALERAGCLELRRLDADGPLEPLPGFPGLRVIQAAGHTPCSQVFVARVRGAGGVRTWIFTGDVVNHVDGALRDLPKPRLYSLLVVPEAPARLARLRAFLREAARRPGVGLLVSHDRLHLERSGLEPFPVGAGLSSRTPGRRSSRAAAGPARPAPPRG